MTFLSTFEAFAVSTWTEQGMIRVLRSSKAKSADAVKMSRRGIWADRLATVVLGACMSTSTAASFAHTAVTEYQAIPAIMEAHEPVKKELGAALEKVALLDEDWNGHSAPKPDSRSIVAAREVLTLLPNNFSDGKIGIDGEGHVYFRLFHDASEALLTVGPAALHLRLKAPGQPNRYVDDEPFVGGKLPGKILTLLG